MERKEKRVLDASVVVKWFVPEIHEEKALELRRKHVNGTLIITAPRLITYEVANALRYTPALSSSHIESAINSLYELALNLIQFNKELMGKSIRNTLKYQITLYDSAYLTLAEDLDIEFITADENLWNKIKDNPYAQLLAKL